MIPFQSQLEFIVEIDKVKNILRQSKLFDGSRRENDAEHSWTICMMALVFQKYSNHPINIERVLIMLLIHDIVEIDAGDTFLYHRNQNEISKQENQAAHRIFGLLDDELKTYFISIWTEFEERKTAESKFASVFDRLEPIIQNYLNKGDVWKRNNISKQQVIEKNKHIQEGSEEIWKFVLSLLDDCVSKGYLYEE